MSARERFQIVQIGMPESRINLLVIPWGNHFAIQHAPGGATPQERMQHYMAQMRENLGMPTHEPRDENLEPTLIEMLASLVSGIALYVGLFAVIYYDNTHLHKG